MSSHLQLNETTLTAITRSGDELTLEMAPAFIVKSLSGSADTLWRQNGRLIFRQAEFDEPLPTLPGTIQQSKLSINQFAYIDLLPIPTDHPGVIHLEIQLENGARLELGAQFVRLELDEDARYIRHL